jgi:hypothetical protein
MMAFNVVKRKVFISIHRERERVNNNKLKKDWHSNPGVDFNTFFYFFIRN